MDRRRLAACRLRRIEERRQLRPGHGKAARIEAAKRGGFHGDDGDRLAAEPSYSLGAAASVYALGAEFELLTGKDPRGEALVASHVETLERLLFPGGPAR